MTDQPSRPHISAASKGKGDLVSLPRLAHANFDMALRQIGFDALRTAAPLAPPVMTPARAAPEAGVDLALRRRKGIWDVAKRQRALSSVAGGIARVSDLPGQGFQTIFTRRGSQWQYRGRLPTGLRWRAGRRIICGKSWGLLQWNIREANEAGRL